MDAERLDGQWLISAIAIGSGVCPDCGARSTRRHGWHERHLQDLPAQGASVTVKLRLQRWQCRNEACERKTFATRLPEVAASRARRTDRAAELVYLFGHGVGGRPGERLIKRMGMPTSDDTILRCVKRRVKERSSEGKTRVVGVDDWAWRKGSTYGTIIVDLERRQVLDLFPERAAGMTADWLRQHPDVEIISRDRCGLFAQGAQEGAPQARQIADRFHIVQNLREAVQVQLGRAAGFSARPLLPTDGDEVASVRDKHGGAEHRRLSRMANQHSRQAAFNHVRALWNEGRNVREIVQQTGFDRRTITKWIRADKLPERCAAAPKTTSPRHLGNQSARLHWKFFKPRATFGEMAKSEMQEGDGHTDCSESAACRSRDRTFYLANCGCGALHQAARVVDCQPSCKSRSDEKGLARICDDASTGYAI